MFDRDFKTQDTVYAQDGEIFSFDHAVGEWAFLYPSVLIQTVSYSGDDYDEHEEWAEHLVRRKLSSISKKPWTAQIDADSKHLISVRQGELDEISKKIGTARVELAAAERALKDRENELVKDRKNLERRYRWVGDINRMLGEDTSVFFALRDEGRPPISINAPQEIRLKRQKNSDDYTFVEANDWDQDNIKVFANENQRENAVRALYAVRKDRDVETEIMWHRSWPFLTLSPEAQKSVKAKKDATRATEIERAQKRLDEAEENFEKVKTGGDNEYTDPLF